MQRIDDDIKATVKKIIQGNEKRKRRMLNGNASAFDRMAYSVIKYSLQGTTQGNGLTGGVPPVRFSM